MNPKLPEFCYAQSPTDGTCIVIKQGESGYHPKGFAVSQEQVDEMNAEIGVTKAQVQAMIKGSMFGWDVPASNPDLYDDNGIPVKK